MPMNFVWDEKFSVGNATMDKQHKRLFELVQRVRGLKRQMDDRAEPDPAKVLALVKELLDYTKYHFADEERLMAECGYPKLEEHIALHREFTLRIQALEEKIADNIDVVPILTTMLTEWLQVHILTVDKEYSSFLASAAGKRPRSGT